MKTYFIRTLNDGVVCGYGYYQFVEVKNSLKRRGVAYETWTESTSVYDGIEG